MKLTAGLLVIATLVAAGCSGQGSTHYTLISQRQGVFPPTPWKTVRTRSIVCDSNTKALCSAISYTTPTGQPTRRTVR